MEICVFGKTWTLTCKLHVKVTLLVKTWNDPTVNTNISPQLVSRKTPIEVQFLTKVLKSVFPAKRWIWKTWKMDLAKKSRPLDCAITSVSSREYVSFNFQPIEWQDCSKIAEQNLKIMIWDIKSGKSPENHKHPYSFLGARRQGGSL